VGWLSAAEMHGAAHQRPQVFQVAVDAGLADRVVGRTRLEFVVRSALATLPRRQVTVPTGPVWISTPELTVLDLCDEPVHAAGLSNAATVIAELAEDGRIDVSTLADLTRAFPASAGRRAGWLLALVAPELGLGELADAVAGRTGVPTPLRPDGPAGGPVDRHWQVRVNVQVELDL
jgi:predicted transcriptional regulator of viral defense system